MNKKDIAQLAKEMSEALKLDQRKDSTGNTTIRNKKTKDDFIKYLNEHPEERFWQSVRNFSTYPFILGAQSYDGTGAEDTFYKEER